MEKGKKMTCGRALAVTAIATLCCTLDAYAASDPPSEESPSRRWNSNHVLRATMALGEGDFAAREGVRLSLRVRRSRQEVRFGSIARWPHRALHVRKCPGGARRTRREP